VVARSREKEREEEEGRENNGELTAAETRGGRRRVGSRVETHHHQGIEEVREWGMGENCHSMRGEEAFVLSPPSSFHDNALHRSSSQKRLVAFLTLQIYVQCPHY